VKRVTFRPAAAADIEILDAIRRLGDSAVLRQVILEGVGPTA